MKILLLVVFGIVLAIGATVPFNSVEFVICAILACALGFATGKAELMDHHGED